MTLFQGPKLYIGQGTVLPGHNYASTRLHVDITDAVNYMIWSGGLPAVWDIFRREDVPALRVFLRKHPDFNGKGDPILSQSIFLTGDQLDELFKEHGIKPYRIFQQPGECVFIPAGSPHQVRGFSLLSFFDICLTDKSKGPKPV